MPGAVTGTSAGGRSLVVANVAGDLLAYRNRCAGCGAALDRGDLSGGTLHCPSLRARLRPAAGGPLRERGRASSSSRCRCCARTAAESGWRVAA